MELPKITKTEKKVASPPLSGVGVKETLELKPKDKKIRKRFIAIVVLWCVMAIVFVLGFLLYSVGSIDTVEPLDMQFGITFAKPFSEMFQGTEWHENYIAILDDLGVKKIRLAAYWDQIEKEEGVFVYDDLDWQINEASKRGVQIILSVGRRLPRWPECHTPKWAGQLGEEAARERILVLIKNVVERYRNEKAIYMWQVENEPFLKGFGECPDTDPAFLDEEIALVRALDDHGRKIVISDSGEFGLWMKAAERGDIFGTTMYRVVFTKYFGQITYPLPPGFFRLKAGALKLLRGFDKEIMVIELQAEPWGHLQLYETPLSVHMGSMDHKQFAHNLNYVKQVGFKENFLWGAEWWYWVKQTQNDPFYWEEARKLFKK